MTFLAGLHGGLRAQTVPGVMPVPSQLLAGDGRFELIEATRLQVHGNADDSLLWSAADRWLQTEKKRTGIAFQQKRATPGSATAAGTIVITVHRLEVAAIDVDESYALKVTSQGVALDAETTLGAVRGLATLNQLIIVNGETPYISAVTIHDAPRFPWRGLMLDTSRHFIPLDLVERNIDAMEAVKLNVLHFHLSDDQGVRIASERFKLLQSEASDGQYYTKDQMRELIDYAAHRGVVIVPEFDMPGHSQSWFSAYPELSSSPGPFEPGSPFGGTPGKKLSPQALMKAFAETSMPAFDPTREETYQFLDQFLGEMAELFPSPYMHIGGDENNGVVWKSNPRIVQYMKHHGMATTAELQAYFIGRVGTILEAHGKKMVAWEEAYAPDKFKNATFQVWSTTPSVDITKERMSGNNRLLISRGFYLDYFLPAAQHYLNPSLPATASPNSETPVRGGEAAMWSEVEDHWNVDSRIWPRAAAIAERLWSPASVTDVDDMYRRLFLVNSQLDQQGLDTISAYQRQIRRMAGTLPAAPLEDFLNVLTPTPGFGRLFAMVSLPAYQRDSYSPLNGVDDLLLVDSETEFAFHIALKRWRQTHDPGQERILRGYLSRWAACTEVLRPYFEQNSQLREVSSQADLLARLSTLALQKLGTTPNGSPQNNDELPSLLLEAASSRAGTSLAVLPELKEILLGQQLP
jgi:hexosaminidase